MGYIYLTIAIIAEVIATAALKASDGFAHLWPSVIVVIGYSLSLYFLSLVLKTVSVGVAYAIWSGLGIVLISIVGIFMFDQHLDTPAIVGIVLIISGIIVMNVFSGAVNH